MWIVRVPRVSSSSGHPLPSAFVQCERMSSAPPSHDHTTDPDGSPTAIAIVNVFGAFYGVASSPAASVVSAPLENTKSGTDLTRAGR